VVTAAPLIVLGGGITVTIIGEIAHRTGYSALPVLIAEVCTGSAGVGLVSVLFPDYWRLVVRSVTVRLVREGAIVETQNLFGPSFGWLLLFGLVLVLSVPYLGWASWKTMDDPRWAVPVVYGWYLLGLATLQIRFVGEFAIFSALFAGLGFVHLAERIDVSRPPVPFDSETDGRSFVFPGRRQLVALILLFLLIGGLGIVQVPIKVNQLTVTDTQYRTAAWMDGYSDGENWEYPQDYVFSQWSRNRVYNYFVNGESRSYTFAQDNYERFLLSDDPERWYERLRNRAGFIVFAGEAAPSGSVGAQLAAFGSRTEDTSGLAHYRAIHVSGENRVFRLVPGATISGGGAPNSTVTVTTTVRLDDRSVTYEREVKTTADGRYRVTVPYPGEYTANGETVQVSERAVEMGENVTV
jgi:dolichyl-diphosphooligosaccharide--protein glycosyltransferase